MPIVGNSRGFVRVHHMFEDRADDRPLRDERDEQPSHSAAGDPAPGGRRTDHEQAAQHRHGARGIGCPFDRRVARTELERGVEPPERDRGERDHAQRRDADPPPTRQPQVLRSADRLGPEPGEHAADQAQHEPTAEITQVEGRPAHRGEEWRGPDEHHVGDVRRPRGDEARQQRSACEIGAVRDLEGEDHSGQRGFEDRGNTGRRARDHQHLGVVASEPRRETLLDRRPDRAADEHRRALEAEGVSRTERDRRADRLAPQGDETQSATPLVVGPHVGVGGRRVAVTPQRIEQGDRDETDGGNESDDEEWLVRQRLDDRLDRAVEPGDAKAGQHADHHRQHQRQVEPAQHFCRVPAGSIECHCSHRCRSLEASKVGFFVHPGAMTASTAPAATISPGAALVSRTTPAEVVD